MRRTAKNMLTKRLIEEREGEWEAVEEKVGNKGGAEGHNCL